MMRRSSVQKYGRSFMDAVNHGTLSSGPKSITIPITLVAEGRVLAEIVAKETLQ
jgi:hypothetical protein